MATVAWDIPEVPALPAPGRVGRRGAGGPCRRGAVYGRRRIGVLAVTVAVVWTAAGALEPPGRDAARGRSPVVGHRAGYTRVVVRAGDRVWDIARAHLPAGGDVGTYAAEIVAFNRVDATALAPGTVLRLPRGP